MRYYLTFSKTGNLRFTSHLDMMRLFKRSFKRADFALRYSEGFNPHPKMSFAQPLSLGYVGLQEYLEFEIDNGHPLVALDVPEILNGILPPGVRVSECKELPSDYKGTLSGRTKTASYDLYLHVPEDWKGNVSGLVSAFLEQPEIHAVKRMKKTKKPGDVEIRKQIHSFVCQGEFGGEIYGMTVPEHSLFFKAVVETNSESHLNPEILLQAFSTFAGIPFNQDAKTSFHAVRTQLKIE